jgi:hypothetical protein
MFFLNYHHLRYFRAIAKEGSLTRAAERLNISQSALSTQLRSLEDGLGGTRKQASRGIFRQRALDRFEQTGLEHREGRLGRRHGDVAGIGAERGQRRQHRRAGQPLRAADDEYRPGAVLRALRGLGRNLGEHRRRHERVLVRAGAKPDRGDVHRPRMEEAGRDRQPDLRRPEGDGHRRANGRTGHLAGRGVHARRHVDRDDRPPGGVDPLDHARDVLARRVLEADPEQRVHDHVGLAEIPEPVDEHHVTAPLAQQARTDPSVAAVVPATADHRHPPREALGDELGDRRPGELHQLAERALVSGFRRAGLVRGQQGQQQRHATTTTATAAASSRE